MAKAVMEVGEAFRTVFDNETAKVGPSSSLGYNPV